MKRKHIDVSEAEERLLKQIRASRQEEQGDFEKAGYVEPPYFEDRPDNRPYESFKGNKAIITPIRDSQKKPITSNEYFTGEKNKKLLIHIVQNGIEVTKPLRRRIYDQQVVWKKRVYPIDIKRTIVDSKGMHHLYVSANDMGILSFNKDHEDICRKCGGKMFIDARNARDLIKRNTIQAIWGIDSTHMILLMVFAVGMMAAVGFAFYSFNQDTLHNTQLKAEQAKNTQLAFDYELLKNQTRTQTPNPPIIINPPSVEPSRGDGDINNDGFRDRDDNNDGIIDRIRIPDTPTVIIPDNQGGDAEAPTNGEIVKLPDIIISSMAQGNGFIIR